MKIAIDKEQLLTALDDVLCKEFSDINAEKIEVVLNKLWVHLRTQSIMASKPPTATNLALLKFLPEPSTPLYLVVDCGSEPQSDEQLEYLFEEHRCPVDILKYTTAVIFDRDQDPHGIFEYIACKTDSINKDPVTMFEEHLGDGTAVTD